MPRQLYAAICLIVLLLTATVPAGAQGIIIPEPPRPPMPPTEEVAVVRHRAQVTIDDQVATTRLEQTLYNDLPYDVEADYILPLPEGAQVSRFIMWVDGQPLEARLLDAEEARRTYEEIVRNRQDPALLEYIGRGAVRARVFPIPAHGEVLVEIEYTEVLAAEGGLVRYSHPLRVAGMTPRPLHEVSVSVRIATRRPLRAVYSPAQAIAVNRDGDYRAEVGYEAMDVRPEGEFVLYYGMDGAEMSANLMTYKDVGEDGFFLLLLNPGAEAQPREVVARDIFIVLDVSGSMRGVKMEQAKAAVSYVLDRLNPDDRFNVITFSTGTRHFATGPRPASEVGSARAFVRDLQAGGGTNISRALGEALSQARGERPQVILFFTDGLATEGEIRTPRILEMVADAAQPQSDRLSIYCFGVGYEVNTTLLDTLAQSHRGATVYVRPEEDIEHAVATFYSRIGTPLLAGVSITFDGVQVDDGYPYPVPDLYAGSQLVMVGRYREGGESNIILRGTVNGEPREYVIDGARFGQRGGEAFIPRLWATRKVGHLLAQIRLHGADRELVDEIIALSVRYGIVTPYTSFLIDETEDALTDEGRRSIAEREVAAAPASVGTIGRGGQTMSVAPDASGERVVEQSIDQEALRQADVSVPSDGERVRVVGAKAFVLRDDVWTDTTYDAAAMRLEKVELGGDRYFDLLSEHPHWGAYLALGQRVIIVGGDVAYHVEPAGGVLVSAPTATPPAVRGPTGMAPAPSPTPSPGAPARRSTPTPMPEPGATGGGLWQTLWSWLRGWWRSG